MSIKHLAASLTLALPLLAGCRSDQSLNPPAVSDPIFRRYAALGNSITAGFQSAGINDSTQRRSYAALLAAAMGTTYNYPSLAGRGCPPPFINNVTQSRGPGATAATCDLRNPTLDLLNNVAVPGNVVANLYTNFGPPPSQFDPLKTIFLGGRTELELVQLLRPTFASVWIGSNDVLGALISSTNAGDSTQITPLASFTVAYDSVVTVLKGTGAKVVLINVPNVTNIPYASLGAIYWCAKNGGALPGGRCPAPLPPPNPLLTAIPTFTVNNNCAPSAPGIGLATLIPWPVALTKLGAAQQGVPSEVNCVTANEAISSAEITAMGTAVAGFNAHIAQVAADNGWALVNIDSVLTDQRNNVPGAVLPFPDVSTLPAGPIRFGTLFSLDGVHPSSQTHRLVADLAAAAINKKYGTTLSIPICGTVTCPAP